MTANAPGNTQSKTADFKLVPKKCSSAKTRTACKPAATQSSSPVEPVTLEAYYKPVASSTSNSNATLIHPCISQSINKLHTPTFGGLVQLNPFRLPFIGHVSPPARLNAVSISPTPSGRVGLFNQPSQATSNSTATTNPECLKLHESVKNWDIPN